MSFRDALLRRLQPVPPLQAGAVLRPHGFALYIAPFGIWSLAIWGLWAFVLTLLITAVFTRADTMARQMAQWTPSTWALVVGFPVALLVVQVALRLVLQRRRLEVLSDRVRVTGVFGQTEVPITGVVKVVQHYSTHALSSKLRLHYYPETQVRTISGWLFSGREMTAVADYILMRNRILKPQSEAYVH